MEEAMSGTNYQKTAERTTTNCKFCGGKHVYRQCPAYGKKCHKCNRYNHYKNVCKSKFKNTHAVTEDVDFDTTSDSSAKENFAKGFWYLNANYEINSMEIKFEEVKLENQTVQMPIDTGADISVISSKIWKKLVLQNCKDMMLGRKATMGTQ